MLHLLQDVLTSKDIDFYGTQEHARLCALALAGRAHYQATEPRSPCVGIVRYLDAHRDERALGFLSTPLWPRRRSFVGDAHPDRRRYAKWPQRHLAGEYMRSTA